MHTILDRLRREPALVLGLVGALIALGTAFGLDLSKEQTGAITAVVVAVLSVVTRQNVTPVYGARHAVKPEQGDGYASGVSHNA